MARAAMAFRMSPEVLLRRGGVGAVPVRILFVKPTLSWPRSSGHDVHCYHMMRALGRRGHEVSLTTVEEPHPDAIAGLQLAPRRGLSGAAGSNGKAAPEATRLQERFRSYWGIEESRIQAV